MGYSGTLYYLWENSSRLSSFSMLNDLSRQGDRPICRYSSRIQSTNFSCSRDIQHSIHSVRVMVPILSNDWLRIWSMSDYLTFWRTALSSICISLRMCLLRLRPRLYVQICALPPTVFSEISARHCERTISRQIHVMIVEITPSHWTWPMSIPRRIRMIDFRDTFDSQDMDFLCDRHRLIEGNDLAII